MKKVFILIIFIITISINNVYAEKLNIYSDNAILYNIEEDKVMYEKKPDEKVQIASMTKVMTALVVLEHENNLNKEISFKNVDFDFLRDEDLSISTLDRKKTYTYKEFLYSFILESSADCGYALALDVGQTSKNFSKLMNEKAKELGMNNSKFNNPVGLDDVKGHYSTMGDMLTLMKASLDNEILKEIMSTMKYKIDDEYIYHTIYGYQKKFDLKMPYLIGGKTGFNTIPGYALASFAEKNDSSYILVTTNASYEYDNPKHLKDAKKIYEYYFNNYGYHTVIKKDNLFITFDTKYLKEKKIRIKSTEDVVLFLKNNYNEADIKYDYTGIKTITNHSKKGDYLGTIKVYYKDDVKKEIKVYLDKDVHKNIIGFIEYHKYIIIASFCYITIIISTIIILRKIKKH